MAALPVFGSVTPASQLSLPLGRPIQVQSLDARLMSNETAYMPTGKHIQIEELPRDLRIPSYDSQPYESDEDEPHRSRLSAMFQRGRKMTWAKIGSVREEAPLDSDTRSLPPAPVLPKIPNSSSTFSLPHLPPPSSPAKSKVSRPGLSPFGAAGTKSSPKKQYSFARRDHNKTTTEEESIGLVEGDATPTIELDQWPGRDVGIRMVRNTSVLEEEAKSGTSTDSEGFTAI